MQTRVLPLHLADFTFPDASPYAGETGIVVGHAISHERGVLIVDTGIGSGNADVDAWFAPRSSRIEDLLAEHGIAPREVVGLVNSHLHFDHCGQNVSFPGVPIYVQRREWEVAHSEDYTVLEWVDFAGATYVQVDRERQVLPGVRVLATPGHTPGHQSVVVDADGGISIIAGQAVYGSGEWDGVPSAREGLSSAWNADEYVLSAQRLRELSPMRVYFGHDADPWETGAQGTKD